MIEGTTMTYVEMMVARERIRGRESLIERIRVDSIPKRNTRG